MISSTTSEGVSLVKKILNSLMQTVKTLISALKEKSFGKLLSLFYDGSSLEDLVDQVVVVACWVLLILPMVLVPIYYLGITLI